MKTVFHYVLAACVGLVWSALAWSAEVGICSENFPDGLQSHNRGRIDFGYYAQLQNSPDARLHARTITRNWWSWFAPTCTTSQCEAINANGPSQSPGSFQSYASTTDFNVGYQETRTLPGNGLNRYRTVDIGTDAQLTINSSGQSFYLAQLRVGYRAVLRLSPGDYWVGSLETGTESQIQVVGNGRVRLFVRDAPNLGYRSLYNSPGNETAGSASKLFLYGYNAVTFNTATTFSGYVYSQRDVVIGDSVRLYGAVTAADISLSSNAAVRYVAPVGSCTKPAELRLSWLLDEARWTGAAGEIKDASGNGLVGRAINGATTASAAPALPEDNNSQGTCGYGSFDASSSQYLQAAHDDLLTLRDSFAIGVWVKPRSLPASGLMSILSKDENYEFHLNANGTVNWWWQTIGPAATVQFNSNKALAVGQWSHVLVRYTPGDQRIFINGVEAGRATFAGTPVINTDPLQLGWDQLSGRHFNGELDELRIYDGALSASEIADLVKERHECSRRLQCFGDNFDDGLNTDWAVSSRGKTAFTPAVYSGRLRLTSNANNVSTASALQRLFPAQGNFIQVEFDYYAYNGSGADGIAVILSDATQTPQPGGFGGSLGYAQLNDNSNKVNGFAGGWLGIAVDEYGNFSNPTEGRIGGSGLIRDSVSVRGSGNGLAGYRYLRGTERSLNPEVDDASSRGASPGHRYRLTIDARTQGQVLVTVERKTGSSFEILPNLDRYNVMASGNSQAALPERFYLSLTGSTGGSSNIHEIDNLNICATDIEPIGEQIHHFDLRYSTPSLTCNPQEVTVTACLNADCSQVYSEAVTATLTADRAVWQGGNQLSFTGGTAKAMVQVTRAAEATIGVGGSTPPALSFGETTCSTAGCKLVGVESGFIVDVPTLIANRPQPEVWLRAVKADAKDPQKCVAGFAGGTKTIGFNATYDSPITGAQAVSLNDTTIMTTSAGSTSGFTPIRLKFDAEAKASLTVNYPDAGRMNLNVRYAPGEGDEQGLVMQGADLFISKPYGIHIETDIDERAADERCNGLTIDECPMFIAAGEPFPVRFRAVGWGGSDSELRTAQALADNITTPNFALSAASGAFRLEHTLMAPDDGGPGLLSVPSYDHVLGEISTVTAQSVSEVGIFQLIASPRQGVTYFGEPVDGGTSNLIGRFIPARLGITATASLAPSCSVFSYQGQPIDFAPGLEPQLTVTGYNSAGSVTKNYDRGPFWRLGSPAREAYHSIVGKIALDDRLIARGTPHLLVEGADDGDGSRVYRWVGEQLSYEPAAAPSPDDLPFVAAVGQTVTAAGLTDLDGACHSSAGSGCKSYSYEFAQSPGSGVRLGRLSLGNAHGSELQGLELPVTIETWQPLGTAAGFRPENDHCTGPESVREPSLQAFTGDLTQGDILATVNVLEGGKGILGLSAPGQGNQGTVRVTLPSVPEWLKYNWTGEGRESAAGLASFGIYSGSRPLIFRRELYR